MIKITIDRGDCNIEEASGTGLTLMSELCVIVKAVCDGYSKVEDNSKELCSNMVLSVAHALLAGEHANWGADLEDDENADF